MIYGLQRKKKIMTRMIKAEEKKKEQDFIKIQSLTNAKQNCAKQIKEIKNNPKIKNK